MGLFSRWFSKDAPAEQLLARIDVQGTDEGVRYSVAGVPARDWLEAPFAHTVGDPLGGLLHQLYLDARGRVSDGHYALSWREVHDLKEKDPDAFSHEALGLPPVCSWRPELTSEGSLGERGFRVIIHRWVDEHGLPLPGQVRVQGSLVAVGEQQHMLSRPVWTLLSEIRSFYQAPDDLRDAHFNEVAWARMRRWAVDVQAPLSDYLEQTIVVTPEKLQLEYRRAKVGDDDVIEVIPHFDGAPSRWLERFDSLPLQESYTVTDGAALTRVVLSEPVRQVLAEVKRMPARRVSGPRAEALVANPIAVLGEQAAQVVDAAQVEQALADAGLVAFRFTPQAQRDERGVLQGVQLAIEAWNPDGTVAASEPHTFADAEELQAFCQRLSNRLAAEHQWCSWRGNDLELSPVAHEHLRQLQAWLTEWRHEAVWRPEDLFDLSHYSSRIAGIGVEKPYALPFVQRRAVELDWFVENVLYGLMVRSPMTDETTMVPLTPEQLPALQQAIDEARARGDAEVLLPGAPGPIPLADAEQAIRALADANADVEQQRFDPDRPAKDKDGGTERAEPAERTQLIIKSNIDVIEHAETRENLLTMQPGTRPRLPACLKPSTQLKAHQHHGVAWLQHLWAHSPLACRGALLADDMGLGKTLQLLTFIAACLEEDETLDPVLVIAPVALLENWKAEAERFFEPGSLHILTLYGQTLRQLRIPPESLDSELTRSGITKLLRKDWVGDARIVLTTYETLRDLEFTLAAQPWSIMVCDEAQKIKNPGAMVTRAAKKQNVRFRIACTGTPVENTLLDLWCLFDFIQPALLGALNQFQRTYKQPIEAKTEAQKAKVEELRRLIEPQTLRRTKQEVAKDTLPAKLEDEACRSLPMSASQTTQYWSALDQLKRQREVDPSAVLQTLHHIRRICSDPHWQLPETALKMPLPQLLKESPKLRWMVDQLERLRASSDRERGEKVIIFCEFRDLQILLQRVLRERFGLNAYVVNGDTSASLEVENSRQKLIDRFQSTSGFNVIVLSPLAVGFGVNIQAANHVIHFTRTWNPAKEDQATDRAYRIGQTRDVTVYYPSVVGDGFESFDSVLHKLLSWKRGLASDMLNASGDLSAADFEEVNA